MVKFVIAKYNENIEWTNGLKHPYIIYDKSATPCNNSVSLSDKTKNDIKEK